MAKKEIDKSHFDDDSRIGALIEWAEAWAAKVLADEEIPGADFVASFSELIQEVEP